MLQAHNFTLAISAGVRAPLISCLFANISKDAPDNLCQMSNYFSPFTNKSKQRTLVLEAIHLILAGKTCSAVPHLSIHQPVLWILIGHA